MRSLRVCYRLEQKPEAAVADNAEWRMDLPEPIVESEVGADYIPLLTALKLGK